MLPHPLLTTNFNVPPQTSDMMSKMLEPESKKGAALLASLPGGAPPSLTALFNAGQYVRCSVLELTDGGGSKTEAGDGAEVGAGA